MGGSEMHSSHAIQVTNLPQNITHSQPQSEGVRIGYGSGESSPIIDEHNKQIGEEIRTQYKGGERVQ